MLKKIFIIYFILVLIFFNQNSVLAAGLETSGQGARPLGLGGAFTGLADSPEAVYYNPAGITQIKGTEVALSIASGEGKEHMALISALLSLPAGIRFTALTREGIIFM